MIRAINAHRQKQKSFSSFIEAYTWAAQQLHGTPDIKLEIAQNEFLGRRRIMISTIDSANRVFAEDVTIIDDDYFSITDDW